MARSRTARVRAAAPPPPEPRRGDGSFPVELIVEQVLEAWRTNNRINLFLLDRIDDEGLRSTLSTRGGRDVARQFAHMHDVRVWHLEARARDLAGGLRAFASRTSPARGDVRAALIQSCERVGELLGGVLHGEPKRRGAKKGPIQQLAYFIAHESHHRGSILLTLKQSGHKLDQAVSYAIWDWDRI